MKDATRRILMSPSAATLVAANVVPIFGVLLGGWRIFPLVLLYWLENGIVGVITILKILTARSMQQPKSWKRPIPPSLAMIAKGAMSAFFTLHYGIFWTVHGVFVVALFSGEGLGSTDTGDGIHAARSLLGEPGMLAAVAALAASHGWSFIWNYLLRGERKRAVAPQQMMAPYPRVVVLHVFIPASAFLIAALGQPAAVLLLFVVMKTGVDLWAHVREHRKARAGDAPPQTNKET